MYFSFLSKFVYNTFIVSMP